MESISLNLWAMYIAIIFFIVSMYLIIKAISVSIKKRRKFNKLNYYPTPKPIMVDLFNNGNVLVMFTPAGIDKAPEIEMEYPINLITYTIIKNDEIYILVEDY